jgi:glycosyltransferase involved in cell wall biosynthesis
MTELSLIDPKDHELAFREPLISFIVPAYKIEPLTLKRCLHSLSDEEQDYPNREVIVVLDGPNEKLAKIAAQSETHCQVVEIEHGGACAARNAGFRVSKGEIVSFFNSDYIAFPGMVRKWVDALLEHPEHGFVYSGYEYAASRRWVYPSKPFNEYLLGVANFIDCGFPLWRKYVVEWDEQCKSLQDWDFWIRVVKTHHVSGFYLGGEPSFIAEPSGKPGGLSEDSSLNWVDRVHYIKCKNGIVEPELVVTSLGAANHGIEIAKMLKADFRDDTLFKPNVYKAVYLIGFYNRGEDLKQHAEIIARFREKKDCKIIVHFVGADIYWLRHRSFKDLKYLSGALQLQVDHLLCENQQSQMELREMGFHADIVPIPPYNEYEVKPLPEEFSCALFLTNRSDFDKYCLEETLSIARAMPDVRFMAYGDAADRSIQYENVICVGNLTFSEWKQFVYKNSCYFRLVRHDTLPTASNEFILAGRDVVTNVPMPYMEYIDTRGKSELNQGWDIFQEGLNAYNWSKTKKAIVQKIRLLKKVGNVINRYPAHDFYSKMLDRQNYINTIYRLAEIEKEPV